MKLFECFKRSKELIDETDFVKIYKLVCDEKEYKIILTKRIANKRTVIHFVDRTILWEQAPWLPRIAGRYYGDKIPIYKFTDKPVNTIFVLKGVPLADEGLDDGIFRSPKRYDENYVNCMIYRRFRKM